MAEGISGRKASGTPVIRFESRVQKTGGSAIVRLPDDASAKLPSRGQVAVRAVLNGHDFQAVLEPDGRRGHWLKVDEKLRQALAVSAGDVVELTVEPASDWPEPDVPGDFQAGRRARHLRSVGGHHADGALGMGALDQCHQESRHSPATRRGWHLETPVRQAAALLLRPHGMHRPGPVQERRARRSDVSSAACWLARRRGACYRTVGK